jgi:hypothetical protein
MAFETIRDSRIRESFQRMKRLMDQGVAAETLRKDEGFEEEGFEDLEDLVSLAPISPSVVTATWFAGWLQRREEGSEDHKDISDRQVLVELLADDRARRDREDPVHGIISELLAAMGMEESRPEAADMNHSDGLGADPS